MQIQQNISLKTYNTFKIDAKAKYFIDLSSADNLLELIKTDVWQNNTHMILGTGANILFTKDYDGIIIKNNILGKEIIQEDDNSITLKVGAGEDRTEFVWRTVNHNYAGIENLVEIPSSVGAAPVQNIGAYGVEAKDCILEVEGVLLENTPLGSKEGEGEILSLSNQECHFGYRESIFKQELKNKFIVTHVTFKLQKQNSSLATCNSSLVTSYKGIQTKLQEKGIQEEQLTPKILAEIIKEIRAEKLPDRKQIGTAGSFFKNPVISKEQFEQLKQKYPNLVGFETSCHPATERSPESSWKLVEGSNKFCIKLSAGQLIDLCGCKGIQQGEAGTYKNHALILINQGNATGQDIVILATHIQKEVKQNFGVDLRPEVNYI